MEETYFLAVRIENRPFTLLIFTLGLFRIIIIIIIVITLILLYTSPLLLSNLTKMS